MKFGYLSPWKTRGKRVSRRVLLKSSKMMSKNHQSGDRRKTNFSTAIMTIIWTPVSLQKANECCTIKDAWKTSVWTKKKHRFARSAVALSCGTAWRWRSRNNGRPVFGISNPRVTGVLRYMGVLDVPKCLVFSVPLCYGIHGNFDDSEIPQKRRI